MRIIYNKKFPLIGLLLIILAGIVVIYILHLPKDPVPKNIRDKISFTVYYPLNNKLPSGYKLDVKSFSSNGTAVLFNVINADKKIVFSEQAKPSDSELQLFYTRYIPFNFKYNVGNINAVFGDIGKSAFLSIPINNTWIIGSGDLTSNKTFVDSLINSFTH